MKVKVAGEAVEPMQFQGLDLALSGGAAIQCR